MGILMNQVVALISNLINWLLIAYIKNRPIRRVRNGWVNWMDLRRGGGGWTFLRGEHLVQLHGGGGEDGNGGGGHRLQRHVSAVPSPPGHLRRGLFSSHHRSIPLSP